MTADTQFWDRIAPKYARSQIQDEVAYRRGLERTRSYLKPADHVLELGCGTGSTAMELAADVASITASDLSQGMLDQGKLRAQDSDVNNLSFHCAAVEAAPQGPFDVILAFNLLHLVPNPDAALREIACRLRPGGLFISKTPCLGERRRSAKYWMYRVMIPLMRLVGKAPGTVTFLSIADLERAIQSAGFDLVETGNYPEETPGRYLVAKRR